LKFFNILLLFLLLIAPAALAFYGYDTAGGLLLVSIVLILLAANVSSDRFEELALGPLKAKLREKIVEAGQLSEQLKNAIKLTLSVAVSAAMRTGRFADNNREFHRDILKSADAIVRDAGLTKEEREEALREFVFFTDIDYRHEFLGSEYHSGTETRALAEKIRHRSTSGEDAVSAIKKLIDLYGARSSELEEWVRDYEYFVAHKAIRRPDVWFKYEKDTQVGLIRKFAPH